MDRHAAVGPALYRLGAGRLWYTWQYLDEIRKFIKAPMLVKGIVTAEDARMCVEHGVNGIIVSNHGGRSMDYGPATLEALPEIVAAVNGRIPIMVDSGFRRGSDVLKALALGANAVMFGRATRWALGAFGPVGRSEAVQRHDLPRAGQSDRGRGRRPRGFDRQVHHPHELAVRSAKVRNKKGCRERRPLLLDFVASVAVGTRRAGFVAVDAGCHRDVLHLLHRVHLRHIAVASVAGDLGVGDVLLVAEIHEAGQAVDPPPGNGFALVVEFLQLLDVRAVGFDVGVAAHARRGWRQRGVVIGFHRLMAHHALQALRQMRLVAVGERLLGRRRRLVLTGAWGRRAAAAAAVGHAGEIDDCAQTTKAAAISFEVRIVK